MLWLAASLFGWFITAAIRVLFVVVAVAGVICAGLAVQEWRRAHGAVEKKPSFHDQVMHELTRFNEAVERGAKRRAEQALLTAGFSTENSEASSPFIDAP